VTSGYEHVTRRADLFTRADELAVKTMIFDIEPLVAPWNSDQRALDRGIMHVIGEVRTVPSVRAVVFATNSARRPSAVPVASGLLVRYLASARKPLRTAPYHDLPGPGAVIGDQLPTDGVLAYRLGYTFLHYSPPLAGVPIGPKFMHGWGQLVRPLLFRRQVPS
jgi:predicted HAD superfamily phosphohydrolase YqeG